MDLMNQLNKAVGGGPITPQIDDVAVYDECSVCREEVPETDGEAVVVHYHRVEGRAVGTDVEFVCNRCIESAEDYKTDRMIEQYRERMGR